MIFGWNPDTNLMEKRFASLEYRRVSALLPLVFGLLSFDLARAHTCPSDATSVGVEVRLEAARANGSPVGTNTVAIGETLLLQMSLHYFPIDPITQGLVAAFEGGTMAIRVQTHSPINVTPLGGVPLVGGNGPFSCHGVPAVASQQLRYIVNNNDVLNGIISVFAVYTNGTAHISTDDLRGIVSGTRGLAIRVDNRPYLQFSAEGNGLQLSWPPDANSTLQETSSPGGAWTTSDNQQNPQLVRPGVSNRFYRLLRRQ